jgi:hypothetical protein
VGGVDDEVAHRGAAGVGANGRDHEFAAVGGCASGRCWLQVGGVEPGVGGLVPEWVFLVFLRVKSSPSGVWTVTSARSVSWWVKDRDGSLDRRSSRIRDRRGCVCGRCRVRPGGAGRRVGVRGGGVRAASGGRRSSPGMCSTAGDGVPIHPAYASGRFRLLFNAPAWPSPAARPPARCRGPCHQAGAGLKT